jgi:hypothetical protein
VAVVARVEESAPDPVVATHRIRPLRALRILVAVALVAAVTIAAGVWWLRGGTFLDAAGFGFGGMALPNEQVSVGIDLTTFSGPSVVLDGVSATNPDGAQVSWSIYRSAPGGIGFGDVRGRLGSQWPTAPVHGYRVVQPRGHPERGATWLVATVVAPHPGVIRLSDITIKYHSGRRVHRSAAHTSMCVLVAPPADEKRLTQQLNKFEPHVTDLTTVDPLVAQFETCAESTA